MPNASRWTARWPTCSPQSSRPADYLLGGQKRDTKAVPARSDPRRRPVVAAAAIQRRCWDAFAARGGNGRANPSNGPRPDRAGSGLPGRLTPPDTPNPLTLFVNCLHLAHRFPCRRGEPPARMRRVSGSTSPKPLTIGDRVFEWGARTFVMGIINVTPDSFSGDGLGTDVDAAVELGCAPRQPRAPTSSTSAASRRGPAPRRSTRRKRSDASCRSSSGWRGKSTIPISIDTSKAEVAEAALDGGRGAAERRLGPPPRPGDGRRPRALRRARRRHAQPARPPLPRRHRRHPRRAGERASSSQRPPACRATGSSSTPASASAGACSTTWRYCAGSAS